ncbi:MAG: hypothetical protein DME60_10480 [Verrucomicrobia bacterium]|nr:MAG: hypothetical protein DME60_10480 [Verrucomicrobiota bacterium]
MNQLSPAHRKIGNGGTSRNGFRWWTKLPYVDKDRWLFSYLFAGLVIFIFGGVTGVINASYNLDVVVHNTSWLPAHFHQTVPGRLEGKYRCIAGIHRGSRLAKPEANSYTPTLSSFSIRICASRNGSMELITRVTMSILRSRSPQEKATGSVSIHS